jgi:hypothetical protein
MAADSTVFWGRLTGIHRWNKKRCGVPYLAPECIARVGVILINLWGYFDWMSDLSGFSNREI